VPPVRSAGREPPCSERGTCPGPRRPAPGSGMPAGSMPLTSPHPVIAGLRARLGAGRALPATACTSIASGLMITRHDRRSRLPPLNIRPIVLLGDLVAEMASRRHAEPGDLRPATRSTTGVTGHWHLELVPQHPTAACLTAIAQFSAQTELRVQLASSTSRPRCSKEQAVRHFGAIAHMVDG